MRIPKPWLRKQNQTWYVQINGKQRPLGKDRDKAFAKYHELMHLGAPAADSTVRQVLDSYWRWAQANLAAETCKSRQGIIKAFGKSVSATLKAANLKAYHVQNWIDNSPRVKSPTTINDRISLIQGIMNWAVTMGYLESNPIAKMPKPSRLVRQEFLPPDTWEKVLELATDQQFKDYLVVMLSSGARPQEMHQFEAVHFDGTRLVLPILMSKGRRKNRVVYLPPEALQTVRRLVEQYPEGKLFRNGRGKPWNRNSVRCRFRRLKRRLNMPNLTATTLRHSFAHHRLTSGQDALTVAKLMGHVDTRMVATRYGHLDANAEYMQEAANQIDFPGLPAAAPDLPDSSVGQSA